MLKLLIAYFSSSTLIDQGQFCSQLDTLNQEFIYFYKNKYYNVDKALY